MLPVSTIKKLCSAVLIFALLQACASTSVARLPDASVYRAKLDSIVKTTQATGAVLVIDAPGTMDDRLVGAGVTGDGRDMASNIPVRIASVTKTYVAAAVLRLMEEGALELDQSISNLLSDDSIASLQKGGHDLSGITVRHLMSHTAGLPDHVTERYVESIVAAPGKKWLRSEQVALLAELEKPTSEIGAVFSYSDTGYVLLGEIIERQTGQSLPVVVRELLRLDDLGLSNTWWEIYEPTPSKSAPRARQTFSNMDVTDWSATVDLYGGGGLIANAEDLAQFYRALFNGNVFKHDRTLELMISDKGLPADSPYRLGVFAYQVGGIPIYEHGGFWGINVLHAPTLDVTVSGIVLDQAGYSALLEVMRSVVSDYGNY